MCSTTSCRAARSLCRARDHTSFASSHAGRQPFETIRLPYGEQVLWPPHCVQGTHGAALHAGLDITHAQLVMRKGHHREIDSYSAFLEADRKTRSGLAGYLRERGLTELYVCGLATDFCVAWTALDGRAAGFTVSVIEGACRAIDLQGSCAKAWDDMTRRRPQNGVRSTFPDTRLKPQAGSRSTTSLTGRSRSKRRL